MEHSSPAHTAKAGFRLGEERIVSISKITGRKISFLLLIFLGFLPSHYPDILFSSREMSAYWWGKNPNLLWVG